MATMSGRPDGAGISVSMVAEWRIARNLFPIYTELVRQTGQCPPPFSSFGADDRPESLEAVRTWFDAVDASMPSPQFRTAVEAVIGVNDSAWHAIALHFLAVRRTDPESCKKLGFVLTRYFAICSPPSFRSKSVNRRHVADVLQPLIGDSPDSVEPSMPADDLVRRLEQCGSLAELLTISQEIEKWEQSIGDRYLLPIALVQATHLHYLLHLVASTTIQAQQAQVIKQLKGVRERGIETMDCRNAGMSEKEPLDTLIATWIQWKVPNDVEYRLQEIAAPLLGLDKVFAGMQGSAPDARVDAELAALRAFSERLVTQLAAVSQRLQRLEAMVDLQGGWTPSADTMAAANKFRVTPPPVIAPLPTIAPVAARPTLRPPSDVQPPAAQPPVPSNGNGSGNGNGTFRS
jgi:hypothetical protein